MMKSASIAILLVTFCLQTNLEAQIDGAKRKDKTTPDSSIVLSFVGNKSAQPLAPASFIVKKTSLTKSGGDKKSEPIKSHECRLFQRKVVWDGKGRWVEREIPRVTICTTGPSNKQNEGSGPGSAPAMPVVFRIESVWKKKSPNPKKPTKSKFYWEPGTSYEFKVVWQKTNQSVQLESNVIRLDIRKCQSADKFVIDEFLLSLERPGFLREFLLGEYGVAHARSGKLSEYSNAALQIVDKFPQSRFIAEAKLYCAFYKMRMPKAPLRDLAGAQLLLQEIEQNKSYSSLSRKRAVAMRQHLRTIVDGK